MELETFFDPATYTLTYVVFDPESRDAVVIDPVLDYDPAGSRTSTRSVEQLEPSSPRRQPACSTTSSRRTPTPTTSLRRSG
jgi:glyoxylase-like metal-dependent hydrolase (beta-lactamase superfamily II)